MRVVLPLKPDVNACSSCALGSRLLLLAILLSCVLPTTGCVRRRLNVRSNPPGALVYVDNQQIGTTPCGVDFTYYGTREIRLVKAGYETLTVNQPIPTPWYQIPGIDFISENLVPTKIRDNRTVTYNLAPQLVVPTPELLDRANQLRQETLQFPVSPAGAAVPIMAPPAASPTVITPSAAPPPPPFMGPASPAPLGVPVVPQASPSSPPELIPPPQ
jgi:hypothetical protein